MSDFENFDIVQISSKLARRWYFVCNLCLKSCLIGLGFWPFWPFFSGLAFSDPGLFLEGVEQVGRGGLVRVVLDVRKGYQLVGEVVGWPTAFGIKSNLQKERNSHQFLIS